MSCVRSQWRKRERDHIEAVEKIVAKTSSLDFGFKISTGRGHHADVNGERAIAADSLDAAILNEAKKFYLQRGWQLGDLVEQQCTAAACFEPSWFFVNCAGEGSANVTEQLVLE